MKKEKTPKLVSALTKEQKTKLKKDIKEWLKLPIGNVYHGWFHNLVYDIYKRFNKLDDADLKFLSGRFKIK